MNKIEWISVSDILPVDEGDVLILRKGLMVVICLWQVLREIIG